MADRPHPLPTVDVVIEIGDRIVLIRRRNPPHGWALPGGFIDAGERVGNAARREAREETALEVELTDVLGVYSDPTRDPRGPTISTVFIGRATGVPQAGDDAAGVEIGTEVVLLGRQGDDRISAAEWAERLGTIPYEVCCGIGERVPRRYCG